MLSSYFPQRTGVVLSQFQAAGLYPNTSAPTITDTAGNPLHDRSFSGSLSLKMTKGSSSDTIYYTTNGTDPRVAGGGLAAGAITYTGQFTLQRQRPRDARPHSGGEWSART